jgi:hypothetical protein
MKSNVEQIAERVSALITDRLLLSQREYELKAQYRTLSEICEHFPKGSKHKAYVFIEKKMDEIIKELS